MAIKREQIQASRYTSASAMAKALDIARSRIRVGDWVTIREYTGNSTGNKRTISGQVIYKNEHYFTIQTRHYKEAFSFINMALGQVEIV